MITLLYRGNTNGQKGNYRINTGDCFTPSCPISCWWNITRIRANAINIVIPPD